MKKMEEDHQREVQKLQVHKQNIPVTLFMCSVCFVLLYYKIMYDSNGHTSSKLLRYQRTMITKGIVRYST